MTYKSGASLFSLRPLWGLSVAPEAKDQAATRGSVSPRDAEGGGAHALTGGVMAVRPLLLREACREAPAATQTLATVIGCSCPSSLYSHSD